MAVVLDGKKLAEKILADLSKELKNSLPAGRQGGKEFKLVAVLVGDDPQSKIFLRQKEKACKKIGVDFKLYQLPEDISQEKLTKKVKELRYKLCHGVIIQLPLPNHIDTPKILDLVPAEKDVDRRPISPVLAGILALLKEYRISFQNKKVAVVGRGRLVGQPVMEWLRKRHIEVVNDTKEADIVISGVGKPGFVIKGNMIKKGADSGENTMFYLRL